MHEGSLESTREAKELLEAQLQLLETKSLLKDLLIFSSEAKDERISCV